MTPATDNVEIILSRDYQNRLRRALRQAGRGMIPADDLDDLQQQATIILIEIANGVGFTKSAAAAIWTIAGRVCAQWFDKARRRRVKILEFAQRRPEPQAIARPDHEAARWETNNRLYAAVAQLPPTEQAAVWMRHFLGLELKAVAECLGLGHINDVTTVLRRALRQLRSELGDTDLIQEAA